MIQFLIKSFQKKRILFILKVNNIFEFDFFCKLGIAIVIASTRARGPNAQLAYRRCLTSTQFKVNQNKSQHRKQNLTIDITNGSVTHHYMHEQCPSYSHTESKSGTAITTAFVKVAGGFKSNSQITN